jgi:signal transduction histidine kinase
VNQLKIEEALWNSFWKRLEERECRLPFEDKTTLADFIRDEIIYGYVEGLITRVDSILEIDPSLDAKEIVQSLLRSMVEYLGFDAASIRVHDPESQAMVLYGLFPEGIMDWPEVVPLGNTVSEEVLKTKRNLFVPNIFSEEKYIPKPMAQELGVHSLLAIPISFPRFSLRDQDAKGVLNLYYKEADKKFTALETKIAEMFSRRVSYVIARKRIMDLQELNEAKDKIAEQIFLKLGRREGVKMKDLFNLVIPEMAGIMKIQRCSLFSLLEDQQHVILEAGYPEAQHGIGKIFPTQEPYIDALVNPKGPFGDFENEQIHADHILIKNPQKSDLLTPSLKQFLANQQIISVLYIPLRVQETLRYFLVFDSADPHQQFTREKIEIFSFLGKELTKSLRLEKMDDILHDFKNPAIAAAGFSQMVKKMLQRGDFPSQGEKIYQFLDIVIQETSRIQDLALSLYGEGKEIVLDLTGRLQRRFLINAEAIRELKKEKIRLQEKLDSPLWVRCFPLHIDRVLDNLLNNATQAIPDEGGKLAVQTHRQDPWAVVEITNTGSISEEEKNRMLLGETRGRGLHITTRLVKLMGGKMEILSQDSQTTFRLLLPLLSTFP